MDGRSDIHHSLGPVVSLHPVIIGLLGGLYMTTADWENFTLHLTSHRFPIPIKECAKVGIMWPCQTVKSVRGIVAVVVDVCVCPVEVATVTGEFLCTLFMHGE